MWLQKYRQRIASGCNLLPPNFWRISRTFSASGCADSPKRPTAKVLGTGVILDIAYPKEPLVAPLWVELSGVEHVR
jgi:hypothetical protein